MIESRNAAASALASIGGQPFWKPPYGEPEWIEIPAGEFTIGSGPADPMAQDDEKPQHRLYLDAFRIARTPVTNAQYDLFVRATGHETPPGWEDGRAPRGADARLFPWGDTYEASRCNGEELAMRTTTPVGIFPEGASADGVLDMSGNVWEWARSRYGPYPYDPADGREQVEKVTDGDIWVLRGGSFFSDASFLRCAYRVRLSPFYRFDFGGFRVVVSQFLPPLNSGGSDL